MRRISTWAAAAIVALWMLSGVAIAQTVNLNRAIAPPSTTLQSAVTTNANGTAVTVAGYGHVLLDVTCATCSGGTLVSFEMSADGSTFRAVPALNVSSATIGTSTTASGLWQIAVGGAITAVRATVTLYSAGTVTVKAYLSVLPASPLLTLSRDLSTFTQSLSGYLPVGGTYQTVVTNLSDGQAAAVAMTDTRSFHVALFNPGTGTSLLGQQTMSASLPVVFASNQTALPVTVASGGIASGGVASGALAAGAAVDGAFVTWGLKTDAKNTATDTTSVSGIALLKQISASVQAPPAITGTVTANQGTAGTAWEMVGDVAHDAAAASVNPLLAGCYASAAAPSDVSADNDATRLWCLRNGALAINPTYGGNLAATGVGAAGATTPRIVDVSSGTSGSAVPTQGSYAHGIGSSNLTPVIACDNYKALNLTTATTTEIIPAAGASKNNYICSYSVMANGTAVVTLKYGTGTDCATSPVALSPAWDLTAQAGLTRGSGLGMVITDKTAGVTAKAICVTSSAAVNVHVEVTYTQF